MEADANRRNNSESSSKRLSLYGNPHVEGGEKRKYYGMTSMGDAESVITSDSIAVIRKKFHFPNDVLIVAPKKSDRVLTPPSGFITVHEMTLRAGLRFPPAPELLEIFKTFGVVLPQFLYRTITIIVGLTAFFRERGATLSVEHLSKICKFSCDTQGRISCRSNKKLSDFMIRDPPKNWVSSFFFVKNEWGLPEKWGRLKELPNSLHIGDEDILRILNFPDAEGLQNELRFISMYVTEEKLFRVGLSIQAGRSHAIQLKKSEKVLETNFKRSSKISLKDRKEDELPSPKKRKNSDRIISVKEGSRKIIRSSRVDTISIDSDSGIRSSKLSVPEDILKHICTGRHRANELMIQKSDLEAQLELALDDWNTEFVKIKYAQGEYKRRLDAKIQESSTLENQLAECRAELASMSTSFSFRTQEADLSRHELIEARAEINQKDEALKILAAEKNALQKENKKLQDHLSKKEMTAVDIEAVSSKAIEEFKKSSTYRQEIQSRIQEAYDRIFATEVKDLERQNLEEGFTRGFLKGVRLMQRKTGVMIEGLSPSQASEDSHHNSGDEAVESELRKAFSSDDEDVDII